MDREKIVLMIICSIWPDLKPILEKLASDTSTPIDDWVVRVLDAAIKGVCE